MARVYLGAERLALEDERAGGDELEVAVEFRSPGRSGRPVPGAAVCRFTRGDDGHLRLVEALVDENRLSAADVAAWNRAAGSGAVAGP